jgi:excisionase family DNA binding protein
MTGYLTAIEAARALGVSVQTVLRRIEAGAIRAERAGRRTWLIPAAEIERTRRTLATGPLATPGAHESTRAVDECGDPDGGRRGPEPAGRLTRESFERLVELRRRLGQVRLPIDSTELLRREREARSAHLGRLAGVDYDELDPDRRG